MYNILIAIWIGIDIKLFGLFPLVKVSQPINIEIKHTYATHKSDVEFCVLNIPGAYICMRFISYE